MFPKNKFVCIPNAVDDIYLQSKGRNGKHDRNHFVYTSCYRRGLVPILQFLWPVIKNRYPEAKLDIYYGMDFVPEGDKREITKLIDSCEGVVDHGRVSNEEILKAKEVAGFQLYFGNPPEEIDCISVKESIAVGCIPIISDKGVFAERAGYHIPYDTSNRDIRGIYNNALPHLVRLLDMKDEELAKLRKEYYDMEILLSWDQVAKKWLKEL